MTKWSDAMASINERMAGASWAATTKDADAADLERRISEAYKNLAGPFNSQVSAQSLNPIAISQERKNMISMRLRGPVPLKNFETFLEGDKVYTAIVTPNGAVFLEDDAALFPSDTFMAQLRLLLP
jgi:hypothetical protein